MIVSFTKVFLELVKVGLWGETCANVDTGQNLNKSEAWEELYRLAKEQSVQGLVLQGIDWFNV